MDKKKKKVVISKKDMNLKGFSILKNDRTQKYELITIMYDLNSKYAYVKDRKVIADTFYRMEFEVEKLLAQGALVETLKKEDEDKKDEQ